LSIPTNEEEERYHPREISKARYLLSQEDPVDTIRITKGDIFNSVDRPWTENAHWVISNVKSGLRYGPIIKEDLLFLRCLKYAYEYRGSLLSSSKNDIRFWLLLMSVIFIISTLFLIVISDWAPSTGQPNEMKGYIYSPC
tara:strand:- start:280 stop:699 length:420 start_codon:yes stop_codon:yes gene_type:complete